MRGRGNAGRNGRSRGAQLRGARGSGRTKGRQDRKPPTAEAEAKRRAQREAEALEREQYGEPIPFGFVRGSAPEKWADRWHARHPHAPLTMQALGERPLEMADGAAVLRAGGVLLVRAPSATAPARTAIDGQTQPLHAVKLYEEAIGLLTEKNADFADIGEISELELLGLTTLLDHPEHLAGWPAASPWQNPEWAPHTAAQAAELVSTGLGAMLAPLPLARHISKRREHSVIPLADNLDLPTTAIYVVWLQTLDSPRMQELVGLFRGRSARSSR